MGKPLGNKTMGHRFQQNGTKCSATTSSPCVEQMSPRCGQYNNEFTSDELEQKLLLFMQESENIRTWKSYKI